MPLADDLFQYISLSSSYAIPFLSREPENLKITIAFIGTIFERKHILIELSRLEVAIIIMQSIDTPRIYHMYVPDKDSRVEQPRIVSAVIIPR